MILFEDVSKKFDDDRYAVDSLNFQVDEGEFFVLIGPSGSGKTTTLKMINRLIPLTNGTIFIDSKRINDYNLDKLRWNIGYVLQQIALFPHMTIEENISIVPELKQWSKDSIRSRVTELMEMVGLEPDVFRNRMPHELSGGQQQRVGVIRALAADPDIILMDEPFSALDPISREKLQEDIIRLQRSIKKTIVFVTHDIKEAVKLADRICLMNNGSIVQLGTPEDLLNKPVNEFVSSFVRGVHRPESNFDLKTFIEPLETDSKYPAPEINVSATLSETVKRLADHDRLTVLENGIPLGTVSRKAMMHYFTEQLDAEGDTDG